MPRVMPEIQTSNIEIATSVDGKHMTDIICTSSCYLTKGKTQIILFSCCLKVGI